MLSWYWRRSGHTARRKLARLASEICHSPSLTRALIAVWECWESPSPKFLCQLRFLSDTRCTDFWYQDCGVLWVFVQFVSPRIKECTFTSANHIIRAACAKVLSNVYQLIHICNMSDQQFIFHPIISPDSLMESLTSSLPEGFCH